MKFGRKLIYALSLGLSLVGNINANDKDANVISLERAVEREVRKHDIWVEKEIEQDYTNTAREGLISFRTEKPEDFKRSKDKGELLHAAEYDNIEDIVLLPYNIEDNLNENVLDAIDHELWHGLFDSEGKKGIIHRKDYSGPSLEEISLHCTEKITGNDFSKVRDRLLVMCEAENLNNLARGFFQGYGGLFKSSAERFKKTGGYIKENGNGLGKYIPKEEIERYEKEGKRLAIEIQNFGEEFDKLVPWNKEYEKLSGIKVEDARLDVLQDLRKEIQGHYERLRKYESLRGEMNKYSKGIKDMIDTALNKQVEEKIESLNKKFNASNNEIEKKSIKRLTDTYKKFQADSTLLRGLDDSSSVIEEAQEAVDYIKRTTVYITNLNQIDKILKDPNEVMARIIDSLYSLYYGEANLHKFPLNGKDLEFLERFKFEGRPLFRKGIERYRLGLEMIKDSVKPEDVRRQLEYVVLFNYKGKDYNWPEADFSIKGEIPQIKTEQDKE